MKIFEGDVETLDHGHSRYENMVYGGFQQLKIIGFTKDENYKKVYVVKCSICCEDSELYGSGLFITSEDSLRKGIAPCGCAKCVRYSEDQHKVICKRIASKLGYEFLGWSGDYKKLDTRIRLFCDQHGEWTTTLISSFISRESGCKNCGMIRQRKERAPSLEEITERILLTGNFHEDTKFWKSDRLDAWGSSQFLFIECPVCLTISESYIPNLYKGKVPCACSGFNQNEAYIHLVYDNSVPIALKFGVSNNYRVRLVTLRAKNNVEFVLYGVWKFPSKMLCNKAEREVKDTLDRSVVDRSSMPDGFSETTYLYNIDAIIKIYENNGGKRIEEL